ncbi:hypothetical protein [Nocardioides sp. URHA0020]|uniref:hypothetical protein n=1 Tax=Nocardioides sp. URHA0020 TaxID=1380392 RepID=UPI00049077AA|nr:hypothetical protein [Nocardioides sp. URHA0020]
MSATLAPDPDTDVATTPDRPRRSVVPVLTRSVLPFLLLLGCLLAAVRLAAIPLTNFDTYFHLRFGHEFLTDWSLRHPGSVTTYATADWVPTQWLPEVVMARAEDWFGLAGVAWLSGLQLCTLVIVFYLVARRQASAIIAATVTVFALIASLPGLTMRPQVISYILIAVTMALWLRARRDGTAPWLMVPMTWVWAMSHGMWPVGIVIGAVAAVGLLLDHDRAAWRQRLLVPLLSLVAAGLTPVGPALYSAVLLVSSRAQYFSEWDPPRFTTPSCLALLVLLALTVTVLLRRDRTPWFDVLMLLLAAGFAVYSNRTVPVSAAMMVPLAALALQVPSGPRTAPGRVERTAVALAYALALVVLAIAVPRTSDAPPVQPAWMDQTLSALPAGTPVLDEWVWGGYLMWRYPNLDLTSHGYGDTFTTAELDRNTDVPRLEKGWIPAVSKMGVDYALLRTDSPLAYALRTTQGWTVLHRSKALVLLHRPTDAADAPVG